jgi:hypothetical protein
MKQFRLLLGATIALIVVLMATAGVLGWKYYQLNKSSDTSQKKTLDRIVKKVSVHYLLPTNEKPTVALVQDKSQLGSQDFFKLAQNGDYLVIYQKNKLALIYREQIDRLVNVGPVNIAADQSKPQ